MNARYEIEFTYVFGLFDFSYRLSIFEGELHLSNSTFIETSTTEFECQCCH